MPYFLYPTLFRLCGLAAALRKFLSVVRHKGPAHVVGKIAARIAETRAVQGAAASDPVFETPERRAVLDVIYVVGFSKGEPKRYRVHNPAAGLRSRGYRVHVVDYARVTDISRYEWRTGILVLFRAPYVWSSGVSRVLRRSRADGARIVFDIDDLLFDVDALPEMDGIARYSRLERRRLAEEVERYRVMLSMVDDATVSTVPLCREIEKLGIPAKVVRNSLNVEQLRVADGLPDRERRDGEIRVGYYSGSGTHQADFARCEDALLAILDRCPNVVFWLVGYLDLGERWAAYEGRVRRFGFMRRLDMLRHMAEIDINIAPLEIGNRFCESKSELKFFEAGLVEVPTVASATLPYREAITNGVDGFVAETPVDWEAALEHLVRDPEARREMGRAAKRRALDVFGPDAMTRRVVDVLGLPAAPPSP